MTSTVSIVMNLFFGFLFVGAAALIGTPLLYYLTNDAFDYTMISDNEIVEHVQEHNANVLMYFEAFPFVIGVALFIRGILMMRARGQELA